MTILEIEKWSDSRAGALFESDVNRIIAEIAIDLKKQLSVMQDILAALSR